jgi:hypothetical protein
MKPKSAIFKEQQNEIKDELINNILNLPEKNYIILYELDRDKNLQDKILNIIPRIQIYFSLSSTTAITYPEKIKRPYWSIIKHLIKDRYNIFSSEYIMKIESTNIRTKKYTFVKIDIK